MTKTTTLYKVVRQDPHYSHPRYVSAVMREIHLQRVYTLGLTTRPKVGPLLAFHNIADARKFQESMQRCIKDTKYPILEGRATDAEVFVGTILLSWESLTFTRAKTYWEDPYSAPFYGVRPPSGTWSCSSFTPLKVIS